MTNRPDIDCIAHYPTLPVTSVSDTVAFYVNRLGFEERFLWDDPPTHAGVALGNSTVHFSAGQPNTGRHWLYFHIGDVDELYAWYQENGVELLSEPTTKPWGMREFYVRDLNGYELCFGHSDFKSGDPIEIERVDPGIPLERRMLALLHDLAEHKRLTLSETLEEILLHSFEKIPHGRSFTVASPHTERTLDFIAELKTKHGIDYEVHDSYRFAEKNTDNSAN